MLPGGLAQNALLLATLALKSFHAQSGCRYVFSPGVRSVCLKQQVWDPRNGFHKRAGTECLRPPGLDSTCSACPVRAVPLTQSCGHSIRLSEARRRQAESHAAFWAFSAGGAVPSSPLISSSSPAEADTRTHCGSFKKIPGPAFFILFLCGFTPTVEKQSYLTQTKLQKTKTEL